MLARETQMTQSVAGQVREREERGLQLPRLTVVGWSDEAAGAYGSGSGRRGSDGWVYRDQLGRLLEVEVVPPDSDLGEEKQRAVLNMPGPLPKPFTSVAEIQPPEFERTEEEMYRAGLGWQSGTIAVDGIATPFETLDLGSDFWVAVAPLADCILILRSRGVARPGVALVRTKRNT